MCYEKNATAIIHVYAYDSLGAAVTGDAANITATWSLDGDTTPNATNDVNPTELGTTGCYIFNMTAAEMNGDQAVLFPVSATADVYLDIVIVVMSAKTGYELAATGADLILSSSTFAAAMADAILLRNASNVETTAGEHTLCTVILAMMEHSISGSTLTIKRTDGSTTHATKTLTLNAAADPITGIT